MALDTSLQEKHCPVCFIHYAAPKAMWDKKLRDGGSWFCPNGHSLIFTETEADKAKAEADRMRAERDQLKQNEAWWEERLAAERKEKAGLKRQLKRVGKGVCPCCNRSFANLQRHMATQHKRFEAGLAEAAH